MSRGGPGTGVIHLSISSVVVPPCTPPYNCIFLLLSSRYETLWTEKRSVLCWPQVDWWAFPRGDVRYPFGWTHQCGEWTLSHLNTWTGQSWDPCLKPREWGRWYPSGIHRSPPLAPVVTINCAASVVSAYKLHPVVAFRDRHDAGALNLLGNCIQSSSQARCRQGWTLRVDFILRYCGTSVCGTFTPCFPRERSYSLWRWLLSTISIRISSAPRHNRVSTELLSQAVLGVKQAVRIECAMATDDLHPGRKLPFTGDMVAHAIIFHRARWSGDDRLIALAFRCGFCHLLRTSEYLNPSGSQLSRHCILAKHVVFRYRTEEDEMRLVSGAELRRLRIPYSRILVYKITVPSAKNDVYRTGRFNFGSANRPVDGVDICRELYGHAVSSILFPDDDDFVYGEMEITTSVFILSSGRCQRIRSGNGLLTNAWCVIHSGRGVVAYAGYPVGDLFEHLQ